MPITSLPCNCNGDDSHDWLHLYSLNTNIDLCDMDSLVRANSRLQHSLQLAQQQRDDFRSVSIKADMTLVQSLLETFAPMRLAHGS